MIKVVEKGVVDTGSTRSYAELCLWRPEKEFLPAREEVLLGQGLHRVLLLLLCMDSHFIPDS